MYPLNGKESVRINSQIDDKFDRLVFSNGKPNFILKAADGQIIGTSEMYESTSSKDNCIESVKENAPDSPIGRSNVKFVITR